MSIGNDMSPADIRACTEGYSGYGGGMGYIGIDCGIVDD